MAKPKVGFIGGGQMAQALAQGASQAGVLSGGDLVFAEPSPQQQDVLSAKFAGATIVDDGVELLGQCERVVLSVKPHVLKSIAADLSGSITARHLLVSIVSGIPLSRLQTMLATERVIRVMPNTPSQVGAGAAAIAADDSADEQDVAWVERLMSSVGMAVRLPDHLMHAVTGLSGSGPAYIYMVIEALSDGGVAMGLPRDTATQLAAQTVLGAAKMVLDTGLHPGQLKDQVTSPGGTTIAAIRELETAGLRGAVTEAVCRSTERSAELA